VSNTCKKFIAYPWNTLWDKSTDWQQTSVLKIFHYLCNSMLILDKGVFIFRKTNANWPSYNYRCHCGITLSTLRLVVTSRVVPVHYLATPELQDDKSSVWTGHKFCQLPAACNGQDMKLSFQGSEHICIFGTYFRNTCMFPFCYPSPDSQRDIIITDMN